MSAGSSDEKIQELEEKIHRMEREFEIEIGTSRETVGQVVARMHREHTTQVERLLAEAQARDLVCDDMILRCVLFCQPKSIFTGPLV